MKKKYGIHTFDAEEIKEISKIWTPKLLTNKCDILYEDHVPCMSLLLISGDIALKRKRKLISRLDPGEILGIEELLTNTPIKHTLSVEPKSLVCFIDKSTLLEVLKDSSSRVGQIINNIYAHA